MVSVNFGVRSAEKECMDDLDFRGPALEESFRFIRLINLFGGGQRTLLNGLAHALRGRSREGPVRILDVGCGLGDLGQALVRWGRRTSRDLHYCGLERSAHILAHARKHTVDERVSFQQGDLFDENLPAADIILASMVLHHFEDTEIVRAIAHLRRRARQALLINDLERAPIAYAIAWLLTRPLRNQASRTDALLSVRKGFTVEELRSLLARAGVGAEAQVRRAIGWRLLAIVPGIATATLTKQPEG